MPVGNTHGWGIAGAYLSGDIQKLPSIPGVTLHSVAGHHFAPSFAEQWDRINIGYCFFESEIIAYRFIREASKLWDYIVAGSSWCEYHLRIAGMERTSTILQGIDPAVFAPMPARAADGRFIVFSGGKFEFRKGHDLVIAAMRIFMKKHPEAFLACAWHNHWPASVKTMEQSNIIDFRMNDLPCDQLFLRLLAENEIPLERVILYPVAENRSMRQAYISSDVGLFPNRCEGGNNMVMCEYMACGRPVIASDMTGHMDVVNGENALCLTQYEPVVAVHEGKPAGVWFEASVDEILALLEQAFENRDLLEKVGSAAGVAMKKLSWGEAARKFHALGLTLADRHGGHTVRMSPPLATGVEGAAELFMVGRYTEAADAYHRLLQKNPLDPDLYNNLGTVLDRLERYAESVLYYEKALALRSGFFEARFNLANTLKRIGDTENAIKQLKRVVKDSPGFLAAWQNLALCHLDAGDRNGAVDALRQALVVDPLCHKSRADLGELLIELKRYREAVDCFDAVLVYEPANNGVLNSKGIALQWLNELDDAEACYSQILVSDPDNTLALNNMGAIKRSKAQPVKAIEYFDRALKTAPDDGQIRFNRSISLLLAGSFEEGWSEYENRFKRNSTVQLRHADLPRWRGEPVCGKTLLLWCEQGYGDSIQFVRYAKVLAEMGANLIVEAQDENIAVLLARAVGVSQVLIRGNRFLGIDYQAPLLSLPTILGNIPCPPVYLNLHEDEVSGWKKMLGAEDKLKVGIAWAGRPTHDDDRNRSINSCYLEPLAECGNIQFVDLQFSSAKKICRPELLDLKDGVKNFVDSASLIAGLDLVISVDSAPAHLAGALNVPVWILLAYSPDWRWLLEREDTMWYESARLFRQERAFAWDDVIAKVVSELKIFATQKSIKGFF
ncbi:MAG: tetratricopeptide repeat protein [Geobacteraceae bacterium]|nr:tetratricopeptide repeat protein [Geobacteraceae bacterium]